MSDLAHQVFACSALVFSLASLTVSLICWCKIQDAAFLEKVRRLWDEDE